VFYSRDANRILVLMEADAIVTHPQPELRRFDVLETLHIAFAGLQVAGQRVQDMQRGLLIDGTELGLDFILPDNFLAHALLVCLVGIDRSAAHALPVFGRKPEVCQDLLMRKAFASIEGSAGGGNLAGLLF
jgi:hypothetical protein